MMIAMKMPWSCRGSVRLRSQRAIQCASHCVARQTSRSRPMELGPKELKI